MLTDTLDDRLRKATALIPAALAGISELASSPSILTITDAVAPSNGARQRKERRCLVAIGTTMVVLIADAWEDGSRHTGTAQQGSEI